MESKFQDLLKNIIPGFYVIFCLISICYYTDQNECIDFLKRVLKLPVEILVVGLPFLFFILGYINDIISSQIEFWLYELKIFFRPSFHILNNKKKRYTLSNIQDIMDKLQIQQNNFNHIDSYKTFQKANAIKSNNEEVKEFYLSYIFSRNLMIANLVVLVFTLGILISNFKELRTLLCLAITLILFVLFTHRWKQRAFYYSKKVFNSII